MKSNNDGETQSPGSQNLSSPYTSAAPQIPPNDSTQWNGVPSPLSIPGIMTKCIRLEAENKVLRQAAERASYWRQRAKSAEGHLFASDFRAACLAMHSKTQFADIAWDDLHDYQKAQVVAAVNIVLATVNQLRETRKPSDNVELDEMVWCKDCAKGFGVNRPDELLLPKTENICETCSKGKSPTDNQRRAAFEAGASSARAMLAQFPDPLLLMDELCEDDISTAEAMGWNSVWASEENSHRSKSKLEVKYRGATDTFSSVIVRPRS